MMAVERQTILINLNHIIDYKALPFMLVAEPNCKKVSCWKRSLGVVLEKTDDEIFMLIAEDGEN